MLDLAAAIAAMRNGAVGMKPVYAPPLVVDRPPAEMGMAPSVGVYPSYTPYDQAVRDQTAAEDAYQRQLSQAPPMAEVIRPVTPALRSHDLLAGAVPAAILALLGRGRDAAQYLGGYWGGKQQRAESDNQFSQAQSQARNAAAMNAYNQSNQLAQFNLNRADRNLARVTADENAKVAAANKQAELDRAAQAKDRTAAMSRAMSFFRLAIDRNAEPEYRKGAAMQAMAALSEVADDPVAAQMASQIEAMLPDISKPSSMNTYQDLRNQRTQKALGYMDEDHKLKQQNILSAIAARRANVQLAIQSGDRQWFESYIRLYDDAMKNIDDQLKTWMDRSKSVPLNDAEMAAVNELVAEKNQLNAEKSAIPLPPKQNVQAPGEGNAPVTLSPDGGGGFSLNGPIGGQLPAAGGTSAYKVPGVRKGTGAPPMSEADKGRAEKAKTTDKDWEAARKKIIDLRAAVAGANDDDKAAKQRELDYWVKRAESLKPGSIVPKGKPKKTEEPSAPKGGLLGRVGSELAKTAKGANSYSAMRLEAINAIKQGAPADKVRQRFEQLTGKKADF